MYPVLGRANNFFDKVGAGLAIEPIVQGSFSDKSLEERKSLEYGVPSSREEQGRKQVSG